MIRHFLLFLFLLARGYAASPDLYSMEGMSDEECQELYTYFSGKPLPKEYRSALKDLLTEKIQSFWRTQIDVLRVSDYDSFGIGLLPQKDAQYYRRFLFVQKSVEEFIYLYLPTSRIDRIKENFGCVGLVFDRLIDQVLAEQKKQKHQECAEKKSSDFPLISTRAAIFERVLLLLIYAEGNDGGVYAFPKGSGLKKKEFPCSRSAIVEMQEIFLLKDRVEPELKSEHKVNQKT